jgi:glycosyltransferase involved in cell wall biosynthesis
MRVFALTFGGRETASTHYRILQYIEPLRAHGVTLDFQPADDLKNPATLGGYDVVILQKKLLGGRKRAGIFGAARRLVYDVDDAIWHPHGKPHAWLTRWRTERRLKATVCAADLSLAANEGLANHLRQWTERVEVLPMALDPKQWNPSPRSVQGSGLCLGWTGAPGNLHYLEALEPVLKRVLDRVKGAKLLVHSGRRPVFRSLAYDYLPYQAGGEPEAVCQMDVGLLPLPDNKFAAGKSPIKALQYMAMGIPTVATRQDGAADLFRKGGGLMVDETTGWEEQLIQILENEAKRREMGAAAQCVFEENFSLDVTAPKLAGLLQRVRDGGSNR